MLVFSFKSFNSFNKKNKSTVQIPITVKISVREGAQIPVILPPQKRPFFGVCLLFLVGRKNDKTFLFLYKDVVRFPILTKFKHSFPTYLSSIVTPEIFDSEPLWKRITVRENLAFCLLGRHSETSLIFRGIKLEK